MSEPEQLLTLEKRYKGYYVKLIGMLNHSYCWTRQDIGFTLSQLDRYICAPSPVVFEGSHRVARYLAIHRNWPVMYPRWRIEGFHTLRIDFCPPKFEEIQLSNSLILIMDSDHARDIHTRISYHHLQGSQCGTQLET